MIRAAVIPAPGQPVEVREFSEPGLEAGAAILRTIAAEVCGTDVHLSKGQLAETPYPLIPGHICVGEVERVEGAVSDVEGHPIRPGQVVTFLDVHGTCNACWFCLVAKASTRCPDRRVYGITYGADDGLLGGWSEKVYLKPGVKILPLPPQVTPGMWIGGGCAMPTALHAVELAQVGLCDSVVIQGSGPVGLHAAILALLRGAGLVIVIGAPEQRLDFAKRLGADEVISIEETEADDRVTRVRELTGGRGADAVIEASGNPAALSEGFAMARDNGRYVIVGQYTDAGPVEVNPHRDINKKHLSVQGCWGIDYSHLHKAMRVMERWADRAPWHEFVTRRYSLDECAQALHDVEQLRVIKAVIEPNGPQGNGGAGERVSG